MAAPPSSRLQAMLQRAVQAVQWTYCLFWQICPQQGILVWGEGYYNGAIKTRKTVQPMEVSAEEASLQRSQQLRELYESLSAGELNQAARRPSVALSPEDLTESEWFYLMCVSFSFPPGVGLPGKAYAKRQHVWLTGANEVDSKVFSRAILAKSAHIQTVICIPLLDGVVELGTTERIREDPGFIHRVKTFFLERHHDHPQPPKPALSEHSTSNPAASSANLRFSSPPLQLMYPPNDPPSNANPEEEVGEEEDEDEDEEEDEDAEADSDSEAGTGRRSHQVVAAQSAQLHHVVEPSELMQLEMSEDIRLGSPEDGSDNLDSEFHLLAVSQSGNPTEHQPRVDSYPAESTRRWPVVLQDPLSYTGLQPPFPGAILLEGLTQLEDTHYSQTVTTILQHHHSGRCSADSSPASTILSLQSAFSTCTTPRPTHPSHVPLDPANSQWVLKYILFTVPLFHSKSSAAATRLRKAALQGDLSASHVLAERRRREKLNERFITLRSLVPFVTKMDKASILGDTIEYVKQLCRKIQELEARIRQLDPDPGRTRSEPVHPGREKRKMRIVDCGGSRPRAAAVTEGGGNTAEVSIIESDALLELRCGYREGLLLDIMHLLRELRMETTTVHSSLNNGVFAAELRAKVKENVNGRKASIVEVKRAINQIIPLF